MADIMIPTPILPASGQKPPVAAFLTGAVFWAVCVCALSLALTGGAVAVSLVSVAAFAAICLVAGAGFRKHYPHDRLGLCNIITQARAALIAVLVLPLGGFLSWPVVLGVALVALALDGVDGWAARRAGLRSDFGARFDMEVDAVLSGLLALGLIVSGAVTAPLLIAGVLSLGFTRYAYVALAEVAPVFKRPLPDSFFRKAVCVLQIATLIVLWVPAAQDHARLLVALACALLFVSFGRDMRWQARA